MFSHIRWEMKVYLCKLGSDVLSNTLYAAANSHQTDNNFYRWITLDERDQYPFPNVFLRIMEQYEQGAWIYMDEVE